MSDPSTDPSWPPVPSTAVAPGAYPSTTVSSGAATAGYPPADQAVGAASAPPGAAPPPAGGPPAPPTWDGGPPAPPSPPPGAVVPAPEGRGKSSSVRTIVEWVVIIGVALLGAVIIRTVLFQAFYIPSASMEPTLELHDRILVNKLAYDVHPVHRGDIIVFKRTGLVGISDGEVKDLVKRVVGLPGETIQSTPDGKVEINGTILKESYLPRGSTTFNLRATVIPAGHFFVMGDNRGDSADSRVFGPISKGLIIGRAFVMIWPLGRLGLL